jgi:hypothetical protein
LVCFLDTFFLLHWFFFFPGLPGAPLFGNRRAAQQIRGQAKKVMKNKGSEIDFISEIIGLSKEEIEKL